MDSTFSSAAVAMAVTGACLCAGALMLFGDGHAGGVAVGAGLAVANFLSIGWIVRGLVAAERSAGLITLAVLLKLAVLFGGILMLVRWGLVDVLPVIVGYAALPIGIVATQVTPQAALRKG